MKKLFMAVIAFMMTISASAQFYIYCSDGNVIKVDSISMVAPADEPDTPVEPEEPNTPTEPEEPTNPSAGIGVFSVGEGKTVNFSKGNLQYHPANNDWRFAENQSDYIGNANSNIAADYNGWIDLFGWGTGDAPTKSSTSDSDYSTFVDWGTNKIGTDAPNTWRTLSYDEWYYVVFDRPNASSLKGVAQVNGVNGLILLPDNWTCPAGITFKSGFHSEWGVDYYAAYQTFIAAEWSKFESAGAVFLPAAGYRRGSGVYTVQYYGGYWSATESGSNDAGYLYFYSDGAYMGNNSARSRGLSVRLVKDIEGGGATPDTPDTPDTPTEPEEPNTPTDPEEPENTENGHEYVDLGLSVKWATCNVGANIPEEYGDYFAWGETEPKDYYDWSRYKWCRGRYDTQTKYCTESNYGTVDNKTVLESADDAARANWGGSWRMPTKAELDELHNNCTWTWTTQNGVNGYKVTSNSNGNSIFLPAAGYRYRSSLYDAGSIGYCWSSKLKTVTPYYAYNLYFGSSDVGWGSGNRCYGLSVRPVCQ